MPTVKETSVPMRLTLTLTLTLTLSLSLTLALTCGEGDERAHEAADDDAPLGVVPGEG